MKLLKRSLQIVFYLLILALFVSRAASSGFSHDENQFIAPGQLLADHGLLPYIDYPYTHMPYGIAFYTVSAALSNYDFLAGRLFNAVLWALCSISLVWIIRLFSGIDLPPSSGLTSAHPFDPSLPQLLAEFVLVFIFLNDPIMRHIDGPALNHSLATLFGLLSLLLFGRLIQQPSSSAWVSFGSGAFASLAALTRLNYAALAIVLLILWAIRAFMVQAPRRASQFRAFIAGLVVAGIPASVLAASAPAHFFYGNFIYIRLNTIYYQQLLFQLNMTLGSKLKSFAGLLLQSPIDIILYAASLFFGTTALIRFLRT